MSTDHTYGAIVVGEKIPTFNHIINNVYLGDISAATNNEIISNMNIIINISNSSYEENPNIIYHHINIDDSRNENIVQFADKVIDIIHSNPDKKILIHCMNSVSRSVSLVLLYLMSLNYTLKDAFEFLKSKRTQYTKPNIGFIKQLILYEEKKYNNSSMKITDFTL